MSTHLPSFLHKMLATKQVLKILYEMLKVKNIKPFFVLVNIKIILL